MASNYWIKLYHELLDDDKIGMLRVPIKWRFIECLLVAGEREEAGTLPDLTRLAWRLRCNPEKLETDLSELGDAGLLNLVDGQWQVTKFQDRQAPSAAASRQRKYRERKKEAKKERDQEKDTYTDTERLSPPSHNDNNATRQKQELPNLPVHLAIPDLLNAWGEWCQYHTDHGRNMTWQTATLQFKQFYEWGSDRAVAAIENSMANLYTGLVEPRQTAQNSRQANVDVSIDTIRGMLNE